MLSLKLLVAFMATSTSLVQAVTKEDPDCFTKCAIKITSIDGYKKDCANFAHMHGNTAVRYHGSVPEKYEDICEDLIDFANACYCLPSLEKKRPDKDDRYGWWMPKESKNNGKNKAEDYREKKPKLNKEDRAEAFKLKKPKFNGEDKTEDSKQKKPKFDDQGKAAYWEGRRPKIFPEDMVNKYKEYRAQYHNKKKPKCPKGKECDCDKGCLKENIPSDKKEEAWKDHSRSNQEVDQVAAADTPTPTPTIVTGEFKVVAQTVTEQQTETTTTTAFATITTTNSTTVTTTTTATPTGTASTLPFILGDPATCDAPGSCRLQSSPCGPSDSPCSCWATSEGDGLCMLETNCTGLQRCSSSSNCPAGQKCFTNTCCSRGGVCIAPATNEQCRITASP
ncbi:hypothetical protein NW768_008404 [Fusarium equiseti]|uniref:Cell wall protein n=1 Tax=Fusarium equiseti TaxID=61235 RepID=A0ABQ8R6Y1_FUSEQ|nr:hypothetical protein NW768_008404 [Fusarium equiseti]